MEERWCGVLMGISGEGRSCGILDLCSRGKEGKSTGCGKMKGAGSRARPQERSMAGRSMRAC